MGNLKDAILRSPGSKMAIGIRTLLVLTLVAAVSAKTVSIKWTDCSDSTYHGKITNLTVTPNPAVLGKPIHVASSGSVDIPVKAGQYEVIVKKGFLKLLDHKDTICGKTTIPLPLGLGSITVTGLTCPQAAGSIDIVQDLTISANAPVGDITIALTAADDSGSKLVCLNMVATVVAEEHDVEELDELVENTRMLHAPVIEAIGQSTNGAAPRPTVIAHGMGDSGTNAGMKSLCATVGAKYPGTFTLCSTTADGSKSITSTMPEQVRDFAAEVRSHPELANGFNAVGLSQGNVLIEGYIALYNDPPVHNFVSICGPLQGEGTCPDNLAFKLICPIWKLDPYGAPLAFSGYWKDVGDQAKYLKESNYLAEVLNERDTKNATVANNFKALNALVMIEATKDTMIVPKESEQMGFWVWGDKKHSSIVAMRDSDGYKGDWIGLQTLDKAGKLHNASFVGEHIQFSSQFWDATVLPYLNQ